jgi:hypothetical protein
MSLPMAEPEDQIADRLKAFDAHWREIEPELRRIEAGRWGKVLGGGAIFVLGIVCVFLGQIILNGMLALGWSSDAADIVGGVVGVGLTGYGSILATGPSRTAGRMIKERVIAFVGLHYDSDADTFPLATFDDADMLPYHTKSSLEDQIEGDIAGLPVHFCDAKLTKTTGSGKSRRTVTVFRGPLVISQFPKRFSGRTLVVPDAGSIGNFFGDVFKSSDGRVRLESPEFEKVFEVYATDQVEARYLLTPTTMDRLVAFKHRFDCKLRLAFVNDNLLIAIDDRRDWFPNPGLFAKLTDPALVRTQFEEVARVADIVEALNLNAQSRV